MIAEASPETIFGHLDAEDAMHRSVCSNLYPTIIERLQVTCGTTAASSLAHWVGKWGD
jgi:hypothetical protein